MYRLSGGVGSGHSCLLRASSPLPFDPLRPITSLTSSYVRPRLLLLLFPPERRFELRSRRRKFPSNPSSRRLFGNLEFDCTFARRDQRYEKIVAFRRNFIYPPFSFSLWLFQRPFWRLNLSGDLRRESFVVASFEDLEGIFLETL